MRNFFGWARLRWPKAPTGSLGQPDRDDTVHGRTCRAFRETRGVWDPWVPWFGAVLVAPYVGFLLVGIVQTEALWVAIVTMVVFVTWRLARRRRRAR